MLRRTSLLLATALAAFVPAAWALAPERVPSPRPSGWVTDLTGALPLKTVSELNRRGDDDARTGDGIVAVVVDTTDGIPARDFARRLFDAWGIGREGRGGGRLVLVSMNDGKPDLALWPGATPRTQEVESVLRGELFPSTIPPAGAPAAAAPPPPGSERWTLALGLGVFLAFVAGFPLLLRAPRCPRCGGRMELLPAVAALELTGPVGTARVRGCLDCGVRETRTPATA